jgi:hypothetical protein
MPSYRFMLTGLYYESTWLKIGIGWQLSVEVFHIEFQQYLWKDLWDTWGFSYMALRKLVFVWINMTENMNCRTTFGESVPCRISAIFVRLFVQRCGPVQTRPFYELVWLKIRITHQCSIKVFHIEFYQYLLNILWGIWKCSYGLV